MDFDLKPGSKSQKSFEVNFAVSAASMGSGGLEVLATPAMAALMEGAAFNLAQEFLPPGVSTVGTKLELEHLAATPIGMRVTASAELIKVEGRRLTFWLEVYDEKELVGRGSHERFIIDTEKFMRKVSSKL